MKQRPTKRYARKPPGRAVAGHTAAPAPACGDITVLTMNEAQCGMDSFNQRDVFKWVLVERGSNELHYVTRSYLVDRPALAFANRIVPFSWEHTAGTISEAEGYIVGFTKPLLRLAMRSISLKDSVLYQVDGNPVYYLNDGQLRYLSELFARMRQDFGTDYAHKDDLLRNQLSIVIHEAARLEPASPHPVVATNAAERITNLLLTWDIAQELSRQLGKEIHYQSPTVEAFQATLTQAGVPELYIGMFTTWAVAVAQGLLDVEDTTLATFLGRKPTTTAQFLTQVYS